MMIVMAGGSVRSIIIIITFSRIHVGLLADPGLLVEPGYYYGDGFPAFLLRSGILLPCYYPTLQACAVSPSAWAVWNSMMIRCRVE